MKSFNIYITGVGGQGIGLLSQALLRGIDHAEIEAIAVDTHGLAQRGGVVVSQIRCGSNIHSPLIKKKESDLVLGMEVHEAMRGLDTALKKEGTLIYMDVSWQPLPVRLGQEKEITAEDIKKICKAYGAKTVQVDIQKMEDTRSQNMALLGTIAKLGVIPGVSKDHYIAALKDLLAGEMLDKNLVVFDAYANG